MSTQPMNSDYYEVAQIQKAISVSEKNISDLSRQEYYELQKNIQDLSPQIEAVKDLDNIAFAKAELAAQLASQVATSSITLAVKDLADATLLDGQKTRELINQKADLDLRAALAHEQNKLIELNGDRRVWEVERRGFEVERSNFLNNQVMTAINALNSDLQTVKQGVVNFGTMSGAAGQQSSSNNVVR
jgi:hypothetical protein